jgi:hypothetical protein
MSLYIPYGVVLLNVEGLSRGSGSAFMASWWIRKRGIIEMGNCSALVQ